MTDRVPADACTAGEFIRDELTKRGWSIEHFAGLIDQPADVIEGILSGDRPLTPELAAAVARALGWSVNYLKFIEASYQLYRSSL
jgi:plasmid maintenance system antidote protein VapI